MTFRANGREIKPPRVEYALTFMGQSYDGIMAVFFPFPVSSNDFGRVLMYVNDDEKRGVIRFESDLPRGQRPASFHAAFTGGGPFKLCQGSADRKSTRLNSSHSCAYRMPSSACKKKHQDNRVT